jgi:hippurate hydrolase
MIRRLALSFLPLAALSASAATPNLDPIIDREIASIVEIYKTIHTSPELSHYEEKTAALLAGELRKLGFTVTEHLGKFTRPQWQGHGVAAVLKNGAGPTVLVRADMDALPVDERTALPYASRARAKTDSGQDTGVMHACGHDIHVSNLIGTARVLAALKDQWHGTLVLIGQPSEETIDGAAAMLRDGLYEKVPRPDFCLALHDHSELAAGQVAFTPEYALASVSSVDITVRGVGGHGSRPEQARDPIVLASQIVLALQTIVSREISPFDSAVVTVGAIHGGTRRNIIPPEVKLQLTIRTYKEAVRKKILESIERIAKNSALAAGVRTELAPIVEVYSDESTPATYNDPALTERIAGVCRSLLGKENVSTMSAIMGGEDFGLFAGTDEKRVPSLIYWLGAVDPAKIAESKATGTPLPAIHSGWFAPLPEPTLRTGMKTMSAAVIELMRK